MRQDELASATAELAPPTSGLRSGEDVDRGEKDIAMEVVGTESHEIDPAVTARAVRKINLFLIPAMTVGCMLNPEV